MSAGHQNGLEKIVFWSFIVGVGALVGNSVSPGWKGAAIGALATTGWESLWVLRRRGLRDSTYQTAAAHAQALGVPLVVVGAPDRGGIGGGAGDLVVDIAPSSAPNSIQADITKRIPLPDDCCVVFAPYVLEYVSDLDAAVRELNRIAPGRVYHLRVEPWTATAYLFTGAKRTVSSTLPTPTREPLRFPTSVGSVSA